MTFTAAEHMGKARENEEFAQSLGAATRCSLERSVTANFYAALHSVQAYFAARQITFKLHTNRATALARDANLNRIYKDYRELQDLSEAARYEVNGVKLDDLTQAEACLNQVKMTIEHSGLSSSS